MSERKVVEEIIDELIRQGTLPEEKRELAIQFAERELDRKIKAVVANLTDIGVTASLLETVTRPKEEDDDE